MIETLTLIKIASYGTTPVTMTELRPINFIFGSNGTGKTTIGRLITDQANYPDSVVGWKVGSNAVPLAYNRDFVEQNFTMPTELKGVFTLGVQHAATLAKIAEGASELAEIDTKKVKLSVLLIGEDRAGGKRKGLKDLDEKFRDFFWKQKTTYDDKFKGAFEGLRNNREAFMQRMLREHASNKVDLVSLPELEKKALSLFGATPSEEPALITVTEGSLLSSETQAILTKRVIGKDDVPIAAMIKTLGNSDWVQQGRAYHTAHPEHCPFCQQPTTVKLTQDLNAYFDDAFVADLRVIDDLITNYTTDADRLMQQLTEIIAAPGRFLDLEALKRERTLLESRLTTNRQHLAKKRSESSQSIRLESLTNSLATIRILLNAASVQITAHNTMVRNLSAEKATLTAQVWRFITNSIAGDLADYITAQSNLTKAITNIEGTLAQLDNDRQAKEREIQALVRTTTSLQPTIDAINRLLTNFGFQGFSLAISDNKTCYKLIRPDGGEAKKTLSEGEKTFVSFLYFYHQLTGSMTEAAETRDRVVIFDDPVSSLDSDILFIVGTLIKKVIADIRANSGPIKQVFILTHNVYFHKEVSYLNGSHQAANDVTFWTVRKIDNISKLERHRENPVKSSYELLWAEVRHPDKSMPTLQNTMRRIIEHYFRLLGKKDYDTVCGYFTGEDQVICRSFVSWLHDGSHGIYDDVSITVDASMVDKYLVVFRDIFIRTGNEAHYLMMMGGSLPMALMPPLTPAAPPTASPSIT